MTGEVLSTDTKFTPGPWSTQDERSLCDEIWIGAEHPEVGFVSHASVRSGCGETDELGSLEANARLIAAAPDLFSALDSLLNCVDGVHDYDQLHRCKRNALAALNRARGGSSNEGE
jgi:hypothetical protein